MSSLTIMIIDDNEGDQFICEIAAQEYAADIEILKAYDGKEALEVLESAEKQPDLIFLDINMPRMDGHEFLAAYHENFTGKNATVVMLSSSAQERDKEKALAYENVKSYILKPLDVQDIEKAITFLD